MVVAMACSVLPLDWIPDVSLGVGCRDAIAAIALPFNALVDTIGPEHIAAAVWPT